MIFAKIHKMNEWDGTSKHSFILLVYVPFSWWNGGYILFTTQDLGKGVTLPGILITLETSISYVYPVSSPKLLLVKNLKAFITNIFITLCCCNVTIKVSENNRPPRKQMLIANTSISEPQFSHLCIEELDWRSSKLPSILMILSSY